MPSIAEKRRIFRELHASGCFVIPNPWDVGTARYLQGMGFKAVATTSAGAAWSMGAPDGAVGLQAMLAHIQSIADACDVPVNADFLGGFAVEPKDVAENVRACVATGVAGLSIEDSTGERDKPLFDLALAVERVRAARAAIDETGGDMLLVARAESFVVGHPEPLREAERRLVAFAEAGADCLYAPDLRTREEIATIVKAVAPRPVNVLARGLGDLTVSDLADLGVRRISVGGGMARTAWAGVQRAAREIMEHGSFHAFEDAASGKELNGFFKEEAWRRKSR